jgi:hypothetical protein
MTVSHFLTRGELSSERAKKLWDKCKPRHAQLCWDADGEEQWATFLGKLGEEKRYCSYQCLFM